jgi:hypothetical protein
MRRLSFLLSSFIILTLALVPIGLVSASDLKPAEVVARHLDSIAPATTRAAAKSRVVQGTLTFRIPVGGGGEVAGTWGRVSSEDKSAFVMRFGAGSWRGEQFTFDGSKTGFAAATSSHQRSEFAQFISSQDFIIKEGLLGGEYSTGWALTRLEENHARVESLGRKKVHGHELIGLQYFSKKTNDMQVKIYFDPETFRHVLTIYSMSIAPNMSTDVIQSPNQKETRYTLEEEFSDFKTTEGVTLPTSYRLQWTEDVPACSTCDGSQAGQSSAGQGQMPMREEVSTGSGRTLLFDWQMTVTGLRDNIPLDAGNFQLK